MVAQLSGWPNGSKGGSGPDRIALLLPSLLPVGGAERLMLDTAAKFGEKGFGIDLLLVDESNRLDGSVPPGVRVFNFRSPRLRGAVRPLVAYLRRERPGAMHAAMWPLTSLAIFSNYLARTRTRLLVSEHNTLSRSYASRGLLHRFMMHASMRVTYPFADARVVVSEGVGADISRLSGLARGRFQVIHNPAPEIPCGCSSPERGRDLWGEGHGPRILTVGRLKSQKNHRLLIEAFQKLDASADARLVILGTGDLHHELKGIIERDGLDGRVLLPGHVDEPGAYYRSADLFVLSSDYEGFGSVIVEALAYGLPVVSTDCPSGPSEILAGGKYGRLVPCGDAVALATAMHDALGTDHDSAALKRRAGDFSLDNIAEQYLDLLLPRWRDLPR
ncbi:MAG: glycosyltransferase [Lysobacteraceae bacterium]|nr:MAG: glycosyltransferase [Xanthomonadaceae bacterium]